MAVPVGGGEWHIQHPWGDRRYCGTRQQTEALLKSIVREFEAAEATA